MTADGENKHIFELKPNSYFGELALLNNKPRTATIVAKTPLHVDSLDREAFNRLLGPLDAIMKRKAQQYNGSDSSAPTDEPKEALMAIIGPLENFFRLSGITGMFDEKSRDK